MAHKYNLNTFRYRFLLIYGAAALISLIIIAGAGYTLNKISSGYAYFANVVEPTKYNLQSFSIELNQMAAYQQAYAISGDQKTQEHVEFLKTKLQQRINSLNLFADSLDDATLKIKIEELGVLRTKAIDVANQLKQAGPEDRASIVTDSFLPIIQKSSKISKEVNAHLYTKHHLGFSKTMEWLESFQLGTLALFLLLMAGFYYIVHITFRFILSQIKVLEKEIGEIAVGNLPKDLKDPTNELGAISLSINQLLHHLRDVKEFSLHVGKGDFQSDITVFDNEGELGNALAGMRQSLKEVSAEDQKRNWVNQGLTQFLSIIRDYNGKTEELSYQVLASLVKYVKANQGGIFIVEGEGSETRLRLEASFAYDRKKYQEKILMPGQGLVGQAYLERDKIYLKQVPKSYVNITSGLGDATPRAIFIQPLMVNDEIMGVLELASFHEFEPHVQDFIQKVSESVASAIGTAQNNLRNRIILEQSQTLAEQLRAQEEELRQNTEELQATQEEMERRIRELERENASLKIEDPA